MGGGGEFREHKRMQIVTRQVEGIRQWPPERYFLSSRLRGWRHPGRSSRDQLCRSFLLEIIKFESDRQASRAGLGARRMAMRIKICVVIGLDGNDKNTDFKAFGKWPFHFPAATRRLLICKVTRFR